MRDHQLHRDAYLAFRRYLDATYSTRTSRRVFGLSVGYPTATEFGLPNRALEKLEPFENGVEQLRPGYGWEAGSAPMRQALLRYENAVNGTSYGSDCIAICAGATYALNRILDHIYLNGSRRELLVAAPTFYRMLGRAELLADVVSVRGRPAHGFTPSPDELLAAVTPKTAAVFLVNPSNPLFAYYPRAWLQELADGLWKRQIHLIIDESGDVFARDSSGRPHSYGPMVQHPAIVRIVTASKRFFMAEFRLGYILASPEFMGDKQDGLIRLLGDDMGNPPLCGNELWADLIAHERLWLDAGTCRAAGCDHASKREQNQKWLNRMEQAVVGTLTDLPAVRRVFPIECNYNVCFQLTPRTATTDEEFQLRLLEETGVSLCAGSGFGMPAEDLYFRITYALPERDLMDGLDALARFVTGSR
jgi:aspartate/methionine/tyrosine aminotransferase